MTRQTDPRSLALARDRLKKLKTFKHPSDEKIKSFLTGLKDIAASQGSEVLEGCSPMIERFESIVNSPRLSLREKDEYFSRVKLELPWGKTARPSRCCS